MEDKQIIEILLQKLTEMTFWFTTKNDPTYQDATSYYELDQYGDPTEKAQKQIAKEITGYLGEGAVELEDAIDLWMADKTAEYKIAYADELVTKFEPKPVVDQIEAYENSVRLSEGKCHINENYKNRLEEENTKSLNLISSKFTDPNFDSDSNEGQIVMRTSSLFNALSDKGYDVQVTFDNGESQNVILLGQQGGSINITITNNNEPLRAFAAGNFEINDDNVKTLTDIQEQISAL